ncbi:PREDICTED: 5' exonuclease Apollo [Nanorana parkeri]|uniref:5' exonuclease Apollo n=1 Tax=Nanorana parkeri TaxID=125878 RepID=UPI000854CC4D|nr:PREDICTED: 5' exonuclease Apollo [Nanorana parkeri]
MNGAILPNTPIAVDFWQIRQCSHIRLFFLSHMHSDHTVGLSSTWKHPLYCSPITAKILKHKLQVNSKWINALEDGVCHMLPLDDCGTETLAVTLIDANHCPGSVMFLFEGYFGTILYTGDFRYSPLMLKYPPLMNKKIDVLYLDNTNCDPESKLPSRQEATKEIEDIIEEHPEHDIVIGLYSIGKESLLVDLAKTFNSWVVVSPQRMELLNLFDIEDVFTTQEGGGRIRVVEQIEVNYANMVKWNSICPTIAVLPTSRNVKNWHKHVYVVPYSDHSSFDELNEFVSQIRPCSIVPVVKTQQCWLYFNKYLNSETVKNDVIIPSSVKASMRSQSVSSRLKAKMLKVSVNKQLPRGVEFESPEKSDADGVGDEKKTTRSAEESYNCQQITTSDGFSSNSGQGLIPAPLTESTVLVSNKNSSPITSPWFKKTFQTLENETEMPSAIWSLQSGQSMNGTVLSDASLLYTEISSNHVLSSSHAPCVPLSFTRADGLSLLPCRKRKRFGSKHFHDQVERSIRNCVHRRNGDKSVAWPYR